MLHATLKDSLGVQKKLGAPNSSSVNTSSEIWKSGRVEVVSGSVYSVTAKSEEGLLLGSVPLGSVNGVAVVGSPKFGLTEFLRSLFPACFSVVS